MRFRFSVRSFPSCIYGWPGKLAEYKEHAELPSHSPEARANCRVSLSDVLPFELEFKQCSFNHTHLTLTVLR